MNIAKPILQWYLENKRDLPWRNTKDPYKIWLSEIILQQTQVNQGMPYYLAFVKNYPTVNHLASASEEEVLKLWQGLGYYSRARNLHATAQYIASQEKGIFPKNYKGLLNLKGVGDYTASAIASICYNQNHAVVDGNVYRVLSRVYGITAPINSSKGIKMFKELANEQLDRTDPGTYNQAVMEFGARHCKPKNPICNPCVFSDHCTAYNTQSIEKLPVKTKTAKPKKRYFNFMVILSKTGETILTKRPSKGIWANLYQFPLLETQNQRSESELKVSLLNSEVLKPLEVLSISSYNETPMVHKLSHQHLYARFWVIRAKTLPQKSISISEINQYPVPRLIEKFINEFPF